MTLAVGNNQDPMEFVSKRVVVDALSVNTAGLPTDMSESRGKLAEYLGGTIRNPDEPVIRQVLVDSCNAALRVKTIRNPTVEGINGGIRVRWQSPDWMVHTRYEIRAASAALPLSMSPVLRASLDALTVNVPEDSAIVWITPLVRFGRALPFSGYIPPGGVVDGPLTPIDVRVTIPPQHLEVQHGTVVVPIPGQHLEVQHGTVVVPIPPQHLEVQSGTGV